MTDKDLVFERVVDAVVDAIMGKARAPVRNLTDTNRYFASHDPLFQRACELAGVKPTKRQASKWRRKTGRAYDNRRKAIEFIKRTSTHEA